MLPVKKKKENVRFKKKPQTEKLYIIFSKQSNVMPNQMRYVYREQENSKFHLKKNKTHPNKTPPKPRTKTTKWCLSKLNKI